MNAAGEQPTGTTTSASPFTYAELAVKIANGEDPRFTVRLLREVVIRSRRETSQAVIDLIHLDPGSTGSIGWDSVLGGVASISGRDRVSSPALLDWCFTPDRYSPQMFDPLDSGKYRWLDYLRTPVELRVRNVILAYGNLEGV
jgi:hypothetical protein